MKSLSSDLKNLVLLWVVLILSAVLTYGHHGHFLIDCGREAYYPTQILLGKVLYKDMFNIYGPFSYMFNAALFKILGINLNVLYAMGCLCSFFIVNLIYAIAKRFLTQFLSFSVAIFTITTGVLALNLFNFVFPYSYAVLYGLVAFLASVWLLLLYKDKPDRMIFLYLSSFFAGLCIANKYEFLPYFLVILYAIIKIKPLKMKEYYYTIFSLIFVPVFCFGILFIQGLGLNDILSTIKTMTAMAHSKTIQYFYQTQGVYFSKNTIPFLGLTFLKTITPFAILLYGFKLSNKIFRIITIPLAVILMFLWINPASLAFLPLLIIILAIYDFKRLKNNVPLTILTLSCITFNFKIIWGLATFNYGVFFASFSLITVFALAFDVFWNKTINCKVIGAYVLIVSIILGYQNLLMLKVNNKLISSPRGQIYTDELLRDASTDLINYINKNTKKTDKIVILPEGAMVNFMTGRQSDNRYLSLIPLYVETYGEEKIIDHFKQTKPDYIVFNNWDSKDYYFRYICSDYALGLCYYVAKNYTQEKVIDNNFRYLIFKRR